MVGTKKILSLMSACFFPLFLLSKSGQAQSSKTEKYGPILQKLRSATALKELNQGLGRAQDNLAEIGQWSNSSSPQDLRLRQAQSEETSFQIARLKNEVQANLQHFSSQDKSPAKEALVSLDARLKTLLESFTKAWTYNPHLNRTLSACESAKFTAGTLRLERLTKLAERQADRIEFPGTEALSPAVVAATDWIQSRKQIDPGLMTTGHLFDSYCIDFVLETFPLGRPAVAELPQPVELPPVFQKPKPPPMPMDPMQKLHGICETQYHRLIGPRDDNPWLQTSPIQGKSNLDLGPGKKVDCDAVSEDFRNYLHADEDNSKNLEQLIAILDDYLSDRINDAKFHELYEPLEIAYLEGLDQLAELYPEENFQRVHSLKVNWKLAPPPASGTRFVPWIVDFGPNSWNGTWSTALGSQDWHHSVPAFDEKRGLEYSVKASIHDVCIDRRTVSLLGFWGDSACSSGSCLFIKPGLWLQAGN